MNSRVTPKERGLIKGALRRVFSRSELHKAALAKSVVSGHKDITRPRVTKWSLCPICKQFTPTYKMQVDHINPVIPVNSSALERSANELVDGIWCELENLLAICKPCHIIKTKAENALRRAHKKGSTENVQPRKRSKKAVKKRRPRTRSRSR